MNGTAAHITDIYARCLLDVAAESDELEAVQEDVETLGTLLAQVPDFASFLASPYFSEQTRRDLIRKVFSDKARSITVNFLYTLIDHNRGAFLADIVERCRQLYRVRQGRREVRVTVAQPMSESQCETLLQELAATMRTRVDLDVHVNPSIIGGIIIRYGDRMLDNSVRGRLVRMLSRLKNPQDAGRQL
jgi:F-type H+-transporting ATPase subunit delta